jgi:two-component system sensor histidine kinase/response regulator
VMDGYTATRQIRDLERGRMRTPIVALTANAMTGQLERCLQCGMDGLLTKPLEPERLEEVLDRFGLAVPEESLDELARA